MKLEKVQTEKNIVISYGHRNQIDGVSPELKENLSLRKEKYTLKNCGLAV
jgi:hypothetical protein